MPTASGHGTRRLAYHTNAWGGVVGHPAGVTSVIYPWTRIAFIELTDLEDSRHTTDPLMSFFREDGGRGRS